MSDNEERPSKIRKLSHSEDVRDTNGREAANVGGTEKIDSMSPETQLAMEMEGGEIDVATSFQPSEGPPMSKNALKKLRKAQAWEAGLEDRRAKRREKAKEKKARKKVADEEKRQAEAADIAAGIVVEKKKGPKRPLQVPMGIILDCDFDEYMNEKEIVSLGAQLTRSYSENRKNSMRSHLVLSSWGGALEKRFQTVMANTHLGWSNVTFAKGDFVAAAKDLNAVMRGSQGGKLFGPLAETGATGQDESSKDAPLENAPRPTQAENHSSTADDGVQQIAATQPTESAPPENTEVDISMTISEAPTAEQSSEPIIAEPLVVYLTADSPHTLERLAPYTTYIVGAIVDKNRHKGLCYKRACERGIPTARLPIGEYMTIQHRSVLAVNHVVEIMLKWLETGDWGEAFVSVIPKRKEAKLKPTKNSLGGSVSGSLDGDRDDEGEEAEDFEAAEGEEGVSISDKPNVTAIRKLSGISSSIIEPADDTN